MSTYAPPLRDLHFALFDVLDAPAQFERLGFGEANRPTIEAMLEESARFCSTVLAPLNAIGDRSGAQYDPATHRVTTSPGFKDAYRQFVEGGWPGLSAPVEYGGLGMPPVLGMLMNEMIHGGNLAWGNFPLLSHGAAHALERHGEDWQREVFLRRLISGEWAGTMCLTEPHCGTDLGLLKTRAEPIADDRYAITGSKIFITAGEHDLTSNIIHLVLARLPDAPSGSRGISLFVVPKIKVDHDGQMGEPNSLYCGAIEHKMGLHGSATCVMHFDRAEGFLVGEAHKGLAAMFTMMNSARLGVGLQGLALADRAYQNAVRYARERLQSRAPTGAKFPDKPADPIIVQPDVRRMLLTCKALTEGGRLLAYHAGQQVERAQAAALSTEERQDAETLLGFLTPIVKACLTEWGIECIYHAQQCFGGHGYIAEHGIEQLARDARITTLYEGTTGVQAMDLLGRKIVHQKQAGLRLFLAEARSFCAEHAHETALSEWLLPLQRQLDEWDALTRQLAQQAKDTPEQIGAAAWDYLFYSGYTILAYWWARSVAAVNTASVSEGFKQAKRETARFYYAKLLPRSLAHKAAIATGPAPLMALDEALFDA